MKPSVKKEEIKDITKVPAVEKEIVTPPAVLESVYFPSAEEIRYKNIMTAGCNWELNWEIPEVKLRAVNSINREIFEGSMEEFNEFVRSFRN